MGHQEQPGQNNRKDRTPSRQSPTCPDTDRGGKSGQERTEALPTVSSSIYSWWASLGGLRKKKSWQGEETGQLRYPLTGHFHKLPFIGDQNQLKAFELVNMTTNEDSQNHLKYAIN